MKAYLLAFLTSLVLVKAAPTDIQLQIMINDKNPHTIRPSSPPVEISGYHLAGNCALRENWHKPCLLKGAANNRWKGECEDRGSTGGDQYICIHYGLDEDGPLPQGCTYDTTDQPCLNQRPDRNWVVGICTLEDTVPPSPWPVPVCNPDK